MRILLLSDRRMILSFLSGAEIYSGSLRNIGNMFLGSMHLAMTLPFPVHMEARILVIA
jgi:hypothetical protein